MSQALANLIRQRLDALAQSYQDQLFAIGGGYERTTPERLSQIARHDLELVAQSLEMDDPSPWLTWLRERLAERLNTSLVPFQDFVPEQGDFGLEKLLQAISALEDILLPEIDDLDDTRFLWQTMRQTRAIVIELTTQRWREAERKFRQLIDRSPVGIFRTTPEGQIVEVNPVFLKILGYDSLESIAQIGAPGLYEDPADRERLLDLLQQGMVSGFETRMRRADGQIVPISISTRTVEEGDEQFLEGIIEDITERVQAEERLRRSQKTLQTLLDSAPFGIVIIGKDKKVRRANSAALALMGYESEEQVVGLLCHDNLCPAEAEKCPVLDLGQELDRSDRALVTKDGKHVPILKSVVPVILDGEEVLLEAFIDITEQKRLREQLVESERKYRDIVDRSLVGIYRTTLDGEVVQTNSTFLQIFKFDSVEDINRIGLVNMYADPADNQRLLAKLRQGPVSGFETRFRRSDGQVVIVSVSANLVRDEQDNPQYLEGTIEDISEQKRLEIEREETQERRARQVQLSTGIAHEIAAAPTLGELFRRAVTLIKERLDYYHVQVFRYEPALEAAILVAGYGEIGEQLLSDGYRVEVELGVVGTVAATGQPVLISDVAQAPDWRPIPYLPDTQGELALPITLRREQEGKLRDEMLGILDVHSDIAGALTTEIQLALDGLCGRLAIAIESIRLRQEMEVRLKEMDALYRATTREGWQSVASEAWSYGFDPLTSTLESLEAVEPASALDFQEDIVTVPLLLRGETIGSVDIYDDPQAALTPDDVALIQSAAEQATQALERARLFEQAQVTLSQTELLYNAGGRLNAAEDLQEIVAAVVEGVPVPAVNRAVLFLYEHDETGEMEAALVAANWYSGQGTLPMSVGQRYPWKMFSASLDLFLGSEPFFFDDAQHDKRVDPAMQEVVKRQNVRALAVLPLWVGARQLGTLLLQAEEPHHFSEREIQPYLSLTGQMAVAIDNKNLVEQTQEALSEREALYRASAELNTAQSYDGILTTLRQHTILGAGSKDMGLVFFEYPWTDDQPPAWLDVLAHWGQSARQDGSSRSPLSAYANVSRFWHPDAPTLIEDIATDPRLDDDARATFLEQIEAKSMIFIPLVVAGQWLGFINSFYDAPTRFPEAEVRRVMTLSGQAAVAAQNLRQVEESQTRAESEQRLRQLVAIINASKDLMADLYTIAQQLSALVPVDALSLATYTPGDPDYVLFTAETGAEPSALQGVRHLLRGTAPGWVIKNQESLLVPDIRQGEPFAEDEELIAQGIVSRLLLPLQIAGEVTGSLNLSSTQPGAFTQEHLLTLSPVADQIALALERTSLLAETRAALDEVGATHRRYLGEEWEGVLAAIPDRIWGYWDSPEGMVATEDVWTPEIERAVTTGELATIVEAASDPTQPPDRSALAVPIKLRGQTIGVLDFYHKGEMRAWSEDDKALVTALAAQVALALEGQRLFEQIQRRGSRERLTAEVVDRIRAAGDVPSILETATQELGRALSVSRALIRLGSPTDRSQSADDKSLKDQT